jgi:hypothetical protein
MPTADRQPARLGNFPAPLLRKIAAPLTLAIEPRLGIGGRGVGLVGACLAMEVRFPVAPPARGWRLIRSGLRLEALHRRPGFDQRAVDRNDPS